MDDIGMETEMLITAKRIMYVKGIACQIETGTWAKLEPEMRISDFNHVFLWRRSEQFLIGRIWSSLDAKGRGEFPMVICAHCIGLPLFWTLQELLPKLEEIRVPQAADTPAEALFQWNDFFFHRLAHETPVLFMLYLDQRWVDITIGEPSSREFSSLKASLASQQLASEVPYELDEESRDFARNFIDSYREKDNDSGTAAISRVQTGLFLLLLLILLLAAYLRFAPTDVIPDFLRGMAGLLGNPNLPSYRGP
jgi:hypothetical protein